MRSFIAAVLASSIVLATGVSRADPPSDGAAPAPPHDPDPALAMSSALAGGAVALGNLGNGPTLEAPAPRGPLLALPVAGPFFFARRHPYDDALNPAGGQLSQTSRDLVYGSAIAQAAGLAFALGGLAIGDRASAPDDAKGAYRPEIRVAPLLASRAGGVSLVVIGW